jgi:hypothetical protein
MATTHQNSSFKVKVGSVESRAGILPEAGAILFEKSSNAYIAGDGFNWTEFGAAAVEVSQLATTLDTPVAEPVVGGVEEITTLYDNIVYNLLAGFTPAGGNQITMNKDMTINTSALFGVSSNERVVTIIIRTYLDAILVATREITTVTWDQVLQVSVLNSFAVLTGQVLTVTVEADQTCILTTHNADMGMTEVSAP